LLRVLISADMEGATGVVAPEECLPGTAAWERFRHLLVGDVNAAIRGAINAGATEVLVVDGHWSMRNITIEDLDPRADLLCGSDKRFVMMEGIQQGADLAFFVGYHAAAGQPGVLSHTWDPATVLEVRLNGQVASEGLINAVLAGAYGAPVGLVTGDNMTCSDAATYTPASSHVTVKTAVGRYSARCLTPKRTATAIEQTAKLSVERVATLRPYLPDGPYEWTVTFAGPGSAIRAADCPGVTCIRPAVVTWADPDYAKSYLTFQAVASLGGIVADRRYG
jgi:D-amino peptidase